MSRKSLLILSLFTLAVAIYSYINYFILHKGSLLNAIIMTITSISFYYYYNKKSKR
jgi:lipoprotein signal peptidase